MFAIQYLAENGVKFVILNHDHKTVPFDLRNVLLKSVTDLLLVLFIFICIY
jgi:hypothetical protein